MLFVDTSVLYALLVESEADHRTVRGAFRRVAESGRPMFTTNYVVLETIALLQSRIGLDPVRSLDAAILPLIEVVFVDAGLHRRALERLVRLDRRRVSLVDASSFEAMDAQGVTDAFTLDEDFSAQGFRTIP